MEPERAPADDPARPPAAGAPPATAAGWPNIADYWPDAPQRMGPPADLHEDPAAAPTRIGPPLHEQVPGPAAPTRTGQQAPGPAAPTRTGQQAPGPAAPTRTGQQAPGPAAEWPGGDPPALSGRFVPPITPVAPAGSGGRRRVRPLLGAAAVVLLLLGGGIVAYRKTADQHPAADPRPVVSFTVPTPTGSPGPVAVLPKQSPSSAATSSAPPVPATGTFWLVDDVSEISLSTAQVAGGIARVGVPDGSDAVPKASTDGNDIRLSVGTRRRGGSTRIEVQLDSRISWAIRLAGGARQMTLDLGGATVRSLVFDGGAHRIDLTLPRLGRTLPIRMTGGVNQWQIGTNGQVAVRLVARKGGGKVVLYGDDRGGLGRGERVTANGGSGIDVDATAGFGTLTVTRT